MKLEGSSGWFWISPLERCEDMPGHDREILHGERKVIGSATVFYDPKIGGDAPYKHWTAVPEDRREFEVSLGDDGRPRKKDMAGRWRTVDESGTGIRVGSKRPPDMPGDAYSVLTRIAREHDAVPAQEKASSAPPR